MRLRLLALLVACGLAAAAPATAAPGDILVADEDAYGGSGGVIRVDPATGAQTELASGGDFANPTRLVVSRALEVFLVDSDALGSAAVFKVDLVSGAQTPVSSGGIFEDAFDLALAPDGSILVAEPSGAATGVIRVDPATGAQTPVSNDPDFASPVGIALGPAGEIYVVDNVENTLFRVDPATGDAVPVSSSSSFANPAGVAVGPAGEVYIADTEATGTGAVFRINTSTGAATPVSSGGFFDDPIGITVDLSGAILIADPGAARVVRVDQNSGAQTSIASGGDLLFPEGIAVVPNRAPVAQLTAAPDLAGPRRPVTFDGSGSSDPDGPLQLFEWDLDGNGSFETATGTSPTVRKAPTADGLLTATLRVTDQHGGTATASRTVTVDARSPRITGLSAAPALFRAAAAKTALRKGTTFRYRLSEAAAVRLTIQRRVKGRRSGGRCRRPNRRNRSRPRCARFKKVGALAQNGQAGRNRRRFSGRIRGTRLRAGRYRAVLRATDGRGNRSKVRRVSFRIARPETRR